MIDVMSKFAIMFKSLRKAQNLTLQQVADKIGTTVQFISNIENAKALLPPDKIKDTAALFKVSPERLAAAVVTAKGFMYFKRAGLKIRSK